MNKNSNSYTMLYAAIMVVVVATVLSSSSLALSPRQAENVKMEKMGDILRLIGEGKESRGAGDKAQYITREYQKYVTESFVVNAAGERVEGVDAFILLVHLSSEYDKPTEERRLPVFISRNSQGVQSNILPLYGKGLWGPVWGYVALADDWNTVNGVVLDHKGETPGLGAEIATAGFVSQFQGKSIYEGDQLVSIRLLKGNNAANPHAVDALSGGTLTCKGVENMLYDCLSDYAPFIAQQKSILSTPATETPSSQNHTSESFGAALSDDSTQNKE